MRYLQHARGARRRADRRRQLRSIGARQQGARPADHAGGRARRDARGARVRRRASSIFDEETPHDLIAARSAGRARQGRRLGRGRHRRPRHRRGARRPRGPRRRSSRGYSTTEHRRADSSRRLVDAGSSQAVAPFATLKDSGVRTSVTTSTSLNLRAAAEDRRRPQRHGRACARRVRPDAGREGAVRRRRRARAAARRRAVRRAERRRPRADGAPTSRSSWRRSKGCRRRRPSARSCRFRRTKSIRTAAWRRTSASRRRARARCTPSPAAPRASSSRRRRRCCRASRAPERLLAASLDLKPGQDIAPTDLAELLVDAGFTPRGSGRRARRIRRPRRHRRHLSGRRSAAGPPRVHRRHDRIAAHATTRRRSDRSRRSIRSTIVPLRDVLPGRPTRGDDLRLPGARAATSRVVVSERDEVDANAAKLRRAASAQLRRGACSRQRRRSRAAGRAVRRLGRRRAAARAGDDARRSSGSTTTRRWRSRAESPTRCPSVAVRCQPAVELHGRVADWVAEIRRLRDDGETTLFVAATPGRAERTIELLKEYDVFARAGRARRGRALRGGARRRRRAVARLPAARRRPADLRRGRRLRRGAPGARAAALGDRRRFCRTCAISRSAISSSTSTTASACSSA